MKDGTEQFCSETENIDTKMQDKVDEKIEEIPGSILLISNFLQAIIQGGMPGVQGDFIIHPIPFLHARHSALNFMKTVL